MLWNAIMLKSVDKHLILHQIHFCLDIANMHCQDRVSNHATKRRAYRSQSKKHLRQLLKAEQHFSIVELLLQFDVETNPGPTDEDQKPGVAQGAIGLPGLARFPTKPTRSSVNRWIHSVRTRVKLQNWSSLQTAAHMGSLLTGPAADLFHSLKEEEQNDGESLLQLLAEEFGNDESSGTAQTDFLRATLGAGESIVEFYWRLNDLCRLAFPKMVEDKDQVMQEAFIRGLPRQYQEALAPLQFNNPREALRAAQRVEGFQAKEKPASYDELADPVYHLGARPKKFFCFC